MFLFLSLLRFPSWGAYTYRLAAASQIGQCPLALCRAFVLLTAGVYLAKSIVQAAFEYSIKEDISLCGFLGDDCVTMKHTPEIQVDNSSLPHCLRNCHCLTACATASLPAPLPLQHLSTALGCSS